MLSNREDVYTVYLGIVGHKSEEYWFLWQLAGNVAVIILLLPGIENKKFNQHWRAKKYVKD